MKTNFTLLFFCCLFYFSVKAQSEINLNIENLKSDTIIINIGPIADPESGKMDTLVLRNGRGKYPFNVKETNQVTIIPIDLIHKFKNGVQYPLPGSRITFYVNENEKISIDAKIGDKVITYQLKGNTLSTQLAEAREAKVQGFKNRYEFEAAYNEKKKKENTTEEEKEYMAKRGADNLAYQNANLQFAKTHLNSEASALLLLELTNKDSVALLYPKLGKDVQNSYFGKILSNIVRGWYATKPGQKLPALAATSIDGKSVKLENYKGKFILLDFWGSWCKPCLGEIPTLKAFNQKHNEKLVFVGMICKDTKANATAIIKNNGLKWMQLFSETDEFGALFGITSYPTKILIDRNGIVLKTFIGVNTTMMDEIEQLISK